MDLTPEKKKYAFTDVELIYLASRLRSKLTEDFVDLSVYGISAEKIEELETLRMELMSLLEDSAYQSNIFDAVNEIKRLAEATKQEIRFMIMRCRMKWGNNSTQERSLEAAGLNVFLDEALLFSARRVHGIMAGYLPELVEIGLTQEVLNNFESQNNEFENMINNKKNLIHERKSCTVERRKLGNKLYGLIVLYSKIARTFYANTNPANYKTYLIYRGSRKLKSSTADKEEVLPNEVTV